MNRSHQTGFTILEMTIALVIISILIILSYSAITVRQSQADTDRVVAEMLSLTKMAEIARLIPGGDTFTRQRTSVVASFINNNGGNAGITDPAIDKVNFEGGRYLITTTGRVGVVETDLTEIDVVPIGLDASNVGGRSRLVAAYKPPRALHFSKAAYWDKKILYCEGYAIADKPEHCP